MKTELVVLDMAGTTIHDNDAVNLCLRSALGDWGIKVTRGEVNQVMGMPKPLAIGLLFKVFSGCETEPDPKEVQACYKHFVNKMIYFYRNDPSVREISGATEMFHDLHRMKIKAALDTGFSRDIVDVVLERLNWTSPGLIETTVASDEVAQGRPYPDLILEAMRRTGVRNSFKVMKVGDTPSDLLEGQAAQCRYIVGVTYGSHTGAQLAAYPHTHLIDRLDDIINIVGK